jgi:hypothetical protein
VFAFVGPNPLRLMAVEPPFTAHSKITFKTCVCASAVKLRQAAFFGVEFQSVSRAYRRWRNGDACTTRVLRGFLRDAYTGTESIFRRELSSGAEAVDEYGEPYL